MELRTATDILMRCQRTLATTLSQSSRAQLSYMTPTTHFAARKFSTKSPLNAVKPNTTTTTSAPATNSSTPASSSPKEGSQPRQLGWLKGKLDGQSKTAFLNSRLEPSLLTPQEKDLRFNLNGSSSDQLLSSIASHTGPPPAALQQAFDIGSMKDPVYPLSSSDENALGHGVTQDMKVEVKARKPHNFRLKPTLGREVSVTGQIDIGKALRLMEMSCSRNRVRTDARVQRFHERPGLKRKRLAKERWRRRFMEGFRATVLRVKQLRNQGW